MLEPGSWAPFWAANYRDESGTTLPLYYQLSMNEMLVTLEALAACRAWFRARNDAGVII